MGRMIRIQFLENALLLRTYTNGDEVNLMYLNRYSIDSKGKDVFARARDRRARLEQAKLEQTSFTQQLSRLAESLAAKHKELAELEENKKKLKRQESARSPEERLARIAELKRELDKLTVDERKLEGILQKKQQLGLLAVELREKTTESAEKEAMFGLVDGGGEVHHGIMGLGGDGAGGGGGLLGRENDPEKLGADVKTLESEVVAVEERLSTLKTEAENRAVRKQRQSDVQVSGAHEREELLAKLELLCMKLKTEAGRAEMARKKLLESSSEGNPSSSGGRRKRSSKKAVKAADGKAGADNFSKRTALDGSLGLDDEEEDVVMGDGAGVGAVVEEDREVEDEEAPDENEDKTQQQLMLELAKINGEIEHGWDVRNRRAGEELKSYKNIRDALWRQVAEAVGLLESRF